MSFYQSLSKLFWYLLNIFGEEMKWPYTQEKTHVCMYEYEILINSARCSEFADINSFKINVIKKDLQIIYK